MKRLIAIKRGWIRVLWNEDQILPRYEQDLFRDLAEIPGIDLCKNWLDIPANCFDLIEHNYKEFLGVVNLKDSSLWEIIRHRYIGVDPSLDLFRHQKFGANVILDTPAGFLLADEMGLGKTRTAIAAAVSYLPFTKNKRALIIGPGYSREVWRSELLKMGVLKDPTEFCTIRTRNIEHKSFIKAQWTFIHYDIAWAWRSGLIYDARLKPDIVILDEAHWIKNGRTQRAKGAAILSSHAGMRIGLTGTPLDNRPSDLWHLLHTIVSPNGFGRPIDFRCRYCSAIYTGYGWEDGAPSHVEELQTRLDSCYLRRTSQEVGLAIPDLTHSSRVVPSNSVATREHDKLLKGRSLEAIVNAIVRGSVSREVLSLLTKARQATSSGKIAATTELVSDFVDQGESVVVFCWERNTAKSLAERLDAIYVSGAYKIDDRNDIVQKFQEDGGVLVSTYSALKEGVTLHQARIVVLHDLDWKLTTILQAVKRINRIGQKHACQAIWVLAEKSFDLIVAEALKMKAEQAEKFFGITDGLTVVQEARLESLIGENDFVQRTKKILEVWDGCL